MVVICLLTLCFAFISEFIIIVFLLANVTSTSTSKEYIQTMFVIHGGNKYRKRVLSSLLSNSIQIEAVTSVDSIKNGITLRYFLHFIARVTDIATLLFTINRGIRCKI
jgi:hypothetical protein